MYDKLVETQPDLEGKPQIVIEVFCALGMFKKLGGNNKRILNLQHSNSGSNLMENQTYLQDCEVRRDLEERCYNTMWNILSHNGRSVTRSLLISLIYVLLNLEDSQSIESKIGAIQEVIEVDTFSEKLISKLKEFINDIRILVKEVKETRYLSRFANSFRTSGSPKIEPNCTFAPLINNKSRKLDMKSKMVDRANSQDKLIDRKSVV